MNLTFPPGSSAVAPLTAVGLLAPIVGSMLAALACRLNGRASAATRHLIWTLAFVIMAVCIPTAFLPMKVAVPILPAPVRTGPAAMSHPIAWELSAVGAAHAAGGLTYPNSDVAAGMSPFTPTPLPVAHWFHDHWQGTLLSLWLSGFLVLMFTALVGTLRLHGIIGRSRSIEEQIPVWTELLSVADLRRSVRLLGSADVRIPLVTGLWRPTVILPETALQWPDPMLRAALVHELAHITRKDLRCSAFARLVAFLYWFNPAAWFGLRSLQGQAEMAADDGVVVTESHPIVYAESLLTLVRALREKDGSLFPAICMLKGPGIEARVERILDPGRHRLAPRRIVRFGALFCGALATAGVMMVRPVAALPSVVTPALVAARVGTPQIAKVNPPDNGGTAIESEPGEVSPITDLRTQLPGTSWKATPAYPLRGGLAPILTFNGNTVSPAGYRYEINHHDSTVRIFFNHGDTQLMLLTNDGKRLRFTFGSRDYVYALTGQ